MDKNVEERLAALGKCDRTNIVKSYAGYAKRRAKRKLTAVAGNKSNRRKKSRAGGDRAYRQGETAVVKAMYMCDTRIPKYSNSARANKTFLRAVTATINSLIR